MDINHKKSLQCVCARSRMSIVHQASMEEEGPSSPNLGFVANEYYKTRSLQICRYTSHKNSCGSGMSLNKFYKMWCIEFSYV
jgi:hypothetical protein